MDEMNLEDFLSDPQNIDAAVSDILKQNDPVDDAAAEEIPVLEDVTAQESESVPQAANNEGGTEEVSLDDFGLGEDVSSEFTTDGSSGDQHVSAEEFLGEKKKAPKMGLNILAYSLLAFLSPYLFVVIEMLLSGMFGFNQILKVAAFPGVLAVLFVNFMFPLINFVGLQHQFARYDGKTKDEKYVYRKAKYYEFSTVLVPVILNTCSAFFIYAGMKKHGFVVDLLPTVFTIVGCTALPSCFFFISFQERLEKYLKFVEITKDTTILNSVIKSTYVSVAGALSIAMCSVVPFIVKANYGVDPMKIFGSRVLPIDIIMVLMTVIDTIREACTTKRRINRIASFTSGLANRDYTMKPLPITSRDEFGLLAKDLNTFHDITKHLLEEFRDTVVISNGTADELSQNMGTTSTTIKEIIMSISDVQNHMSAQEDNVNTTSESVSTILNNIESLNRGIEAQSSAVTQTSASVSEMVNNIRNVSGILEQNTVSVNSLSDASGLGQQKVEEAVRTTQSILNDSNSLLEAAGIIQAIAEQTNLLAMNAAIEAAHAGDAGKGFGVVADEIRKLAEQSNSQGKVITESLDKFSNGIQVVARNTHEVEEQFTVIYNLAQEVKKQEEIIARLMNEQSEGSGEVLLAMKNINEITQTVDNGNKSMLDSGRDIEARMHELDAATRKMTSAMNEMSASTEKIMGAIENVEECTTRNQAGIGNLGVEIGFFQL